MGDSKLTKIIKAHGLETVKKYLLKTEGGYKILQDWRMIARPEQLSPPGDWTIWVIKAGRGFGKTRTGVEWCIEQIKKGKRYGTIVTPTASDISKVILNGESGFMTILEEDPPKYNGQSSTLTFKSGAVINIFSSETPNRLRGPQSEFLWMDEFAAYRYLTGENGVYDLAMMGLRLGRNPQCVITTTPRPLSILKDLVLNPHKHNAVVTHGSTYDNKENLSPQFFDFIVNKYANTRLGRQEIDADLLSDNPDALFKRAWIMDNYIDDFDEEKMQKIVVAVDPAVTDNPLSDDTGIVVVGCDNKKYKHWYVIADYTFNGSVDEWASKVVEVYHRHNANQVVAEVNNGGDLVKAVILNKDRSIRVRNVRATRGKYLRAEPVAGLYEQNRVHHITCMPKLEDQMCEFSIDMVKVYSPDRLDALVWGITALSKRGGEMIGM